MSEVNLEMIQLDLTWPNEISVYDLHKYVLTKIKLYGEPLRWAITSVYKDSLNLDCIKFRLEAVVVKNKPLEKDRNIL